MSFKVVISTLPYVQVAMSEQQGSRASSKDSMVLTETSAVNWSFLTDQTFPVFADVEAAHT